MFVRIIQIVYYSFTIRFYCIYCSGKSVYVSLHFRAHRVMQNHGFRRVTVLFTVGPVLVICVTHHQLNTLCSSSPFI